VEGTRINHPKFLVLFPEQELVWRKVIARFQGYSSFAVSIPVAFFTA
jgi:hypothetical protein